MKWLAITALLLTASSALAQEGNANISDYLCITGFDHDNADVWLLRSDEAMFIVEEDGKIETEIECVDQRCQGSGFTISFMSSYRAAAGTTFAKVVREGDPTAYILQCAKQN